MHILGSWGPSKLDPKIKVSAHFRKAANVVFTVFRLLHTFPMLADVFTEGVGRLA